MKRVLVWGVAAAIVMWIGLLVDWKRPEHEHPADLADPAREDEPIATTSAPPEAKPGLLHGLGASARRVFSSAKRPVPPRAVEPPAEAKPEARGELGDGPLSREYAELERHYVDEPRNGEWALAEEQRVRGLLRSGPLAKKLALLNCQDTVCKIVLDGVSRDALDELLRTPGLREETALGSRSPYSLRGGQLTLYFQPGPGTQAGIQTPP